MMKAIRLQFFLLLIIVAYGVGVIFISRMDSLRFSRIHFLHQQYYASQRGDLSREDPFTATNTVNKRGVNMASTGVNNVKPLNIDKQTVSQPTRPALYRVMSGDTLTSIAERFDTQVSTLIRLNRIDSPDLIYPEQTLRIP